MSTHPNAMLLLALTPDDLARKTYRAILDEEGIGADDNVKIGDKDYWHGVMEDEYNDSRQIALPDGTIYLADLVTYGYGEKIGWDALVAQKAALDEWAIGICQRHHCKADVFISANYW